MAKVGVAQEKNE